MSSTTSKILFVLIFAATGVISVAGQSDVTDRTPGEHPNDSRRYSKNLRETLAKQRAEREKKEYQELLDRSDQALRISEELERSFEKTNQLTDFDRNRLQTLEKLVTKIRSELGGGDDGGIIDDEDRPSDLRAAFSYLRDSAVKLSDQLKRSTRFTISAAAIQTSNNFLRVIKFLRLRR